MFNKIVITEENFESVMKKLQKICNKHKMIRNYRVLTESGKEKKEFRSNGIGIVKRCTYDKEHDSYMNKRSLVINSSFLEVTKHHFREAFESNSDSFDCASYESMHSLIHASMNASSALVLSVGDKIKFLPFGMFITWTDDDFTRFEKPLTIYKETFIPHFISGKIEDVNAEITKREEEIKKENDWWIEQDMKQVERDMQEMAGYYDEDDEDNVKPYSESETLRHDIEEINRELNGVDIDNTETYIHDDEDSEDDSEDEDDGIEYIECIEEDDSEDL